MFEVVGQAAVDGDDLAVTGLYRSLTALTDSISPNDSPALTRAADLGQFDVDQVGQRFDGEVRDADRGDLLARRCRDRRGPIRASWRRASSCGCTVGVPYACSTIKRQWHDAGRLLRCRECRSSVRVPGAASSGRT